MIAGIYSELYGERGSGGKIFHLHMIIAFDVGFTIDGTAANSVIEVINFDGVDKYTNEKANKKVRITIK